MIDKKGEFTARDYAHLRYNVMGLPQGTDIVKSFPDFDASNEFHERLSIDKNCAIKYMCLIYDPESPVQKKITDPIAARQTAAILAGFRMDTKGRFTEDVEEMMKCMNTGFNTMLIRYLRFFNNDAYTLIVTTRQALYNKQEMILNGGGGEKKSPIEVEKIKGELINQSDALYSLINKYSKELLQGDKNPFLKEHLFALIDEEQIPLRPEQQASRRTKTVALEEDEV